MFVRAELLIVLMAVTPAALAAADVTTVRYVGGALDLGAQSVGGVCTGGSAQDRNQQPTDAPVVAGGVCNVPTRNATQIDLSVMDDFAGPMPFRYQFNGTAPCASQAGSGHGALAGVVVPAGCFRVSIYVGSGGGTGVIAVSRS